MMTRLMSACRQTSLRERQLVGALACIAITTRLAVQFLLGFYESPETWEEGVIALNIVSGQGYTFEINGAVAYALRGPVYPFLLAAVYATCGTSAVAAGALQALLGACLALAAYALGKQLGLTMRTAAAAGILTALHPGLLVYAAKIHQLNLDAPLFTATAAGVLRWRATPEPRVEIGLGTLAGLAVLSRPTFLPVFGAGLVLRWLGTERRRLRGTALVILAAMAVLVPWVVRNHVTLGVPTATTTTGYLLWIGNNPAATGSTITADGRPILEAMPAVRDRIWGRDELEQDRIFGQLAFEYMQQDPLRTARTVAEKVLAFWWFGAGTGAAYPTAWKWIYGSYYTVLVVVTAVGGIILVRRRQESLPAVVFLVAAMAGVSLAQAVFYVDGRHRWAVEPVMLVFAAAVLDLIDPSRRTIRR